MEHSLDKPTILPLAADVEPSEVPMALAVLAYTTGRISKVAAAAMAGLSLEEFDAFRVSERGREIEFALYRKPRAADWRESLLALAGSLPDLEEPDDPPPEPIDWPEEEVELDSRVRGNDEEAGTQV